MTKFKGTPLFGQDSSPKNTSEKLALIGTGVLWLIFLLCSIIIKPAQKEPKYKEVQIVLSSTPVVKQDEAPAPAMQQSSGQKAEEPVVQEVKAVEPAPQPVVETPVTPKVEPKPVVTEKKTAPAKTAEKPAAKPVEKPAAKPVEKPKAEPAKKAPAPKAVETAPVEYAVDPMEAFNNQVAKKPKQEFNWDMFDDDTPAETSTQTAQKTVKNNEPVMSGSAASAADNSVQKVTSTNSNAKSTNQSASANTSSALSNIANVKFAGKAANGVSSETNVQAVSGNGKVSMKMSNGSSRALIDPEKPIINLSEEAAATIDASRTVKIKLKVVESGNVPKSDIQITPASVLSEIVRNEITAQISKWRFEAADYTAYAEFEYKIVKK